MVERCGSASSFFGLLLHLLFLSPVSQSHHNSASTVQPLEETPLKKVLIRGVNNFSRLRLFVLSSLEVREIAKKHCMGTQSSAVAGQGYCDYSFLSH